jgi:hypothetical protein
LRLPRPFLLSSPSGSAVWHQGSDILRGRASHPVFSSLPVHALGTVNYLCVVDKPGKYSVGVGVVDHVIIFSCESTH